MTPRSRAKPSRPAPRRGGVVSEATLRFHRGSPQKAKLVIDQIRGKGVNEALSLLRLSPKVASRAVEKLLRSAVANATHGDERVDADTLWVGEAWVGPGPSLKRFRGRAFGRAFRVLHRSCHIRVRLHGPAAKAGPEAPRGSAAAPEKAAGTGS